MTGKRTMAVDRNVPRQVMHLIRDRERALLKASTLEQRGGGSVVEEDREPLPHGDGRISECLTRRRRNSYSEGMKATVSEKGQVTIPKALRNRLGIRPGAVLEFEAEGGRLVARKTAQRDVLDSVYGTLRMAESVDEFIERIRGR